MSSCTLSRGSENSCSDTASTNGCALSAVRALSAFCTTVVEACENPQSLHGAPCQFGCFLYLAEHFDVLVVDHDDLARLKRWRGARRRGSVSRLAAWLSLLAILARTFLAADQAPECIRRPPAAVAAGAPSSAFALLPTLRWGQERRTG